MNILIVSYIYPNTEDPRAGIFVHEQAKELVKQGNNVQVITSNVSKRDENGELDNIAVYRLNCHQFFKGLIFNLKLLGKIIELKSKIDIIHIHFIGLNTLFCWRVWVPSRACLEPENNTRALPWNWSLP